MTFPCLNLYVPYYRPASEQRWVEIQCCLGRNLSSGLFRRIYLLVDTDIPASASLSDRRVTILPLGGRPTYADVMSHANGPKGPGTDQWVVMANSDIIFDDTINTLHMVGDQDKPPFFCITRHTFSYRGVWEREPGADGCQDAWAWKTPLKGSLVKKVEESDKGKGLRFGVWGSENRLAYEAHAAGYLVFNPGLVVVAKHYHWANERPLAGRQHQIRGKYMFPIPARLGDPIQARVGYCHGPGGLEQLTMEQLAKVPDNCECERCQA